MCALKESLTVYKIDEWALLAVGHTYTHVGRWLIIHIECMHAMSYHWLIYRVSFHLSFY